MIITCANCNTNYNLSSTEIQGLHQSILPCQHCKKNIKIAICPHCRSYYSITFSTAQREKYSLTCEKCSQSFTIEFPVIRNARTAEITHDNVPPSLKPEKKQKISILERYTRKLRYRPPLTEKYTHHHDGAFSLKAFLSVCATAFTRTKLAASAAGIIILFFILFIYNLLTGMFMPSENSLSHQYVNPFVNLLPLALIFFFYILISSIVSHITMESMRGTASIGIKRIAGFLSHSFLPAFISNIVLLMAASIVLILFGKIPLVGPLLFALLFLPIYIISLVIILIVIIGFWFYPPIIADSFDNGDNNQSHMPKLVHFIRRHNFSLIYIIPILMIASALAFSAIYILHYGSITLSLLMVKYFIPEEGAMLFSAIPGEFLRFSDLALFGADSSMLKTLIIDPFFSHSIGGFILGMILISISVFLFSSFISITSTLSTHLYVLMEKGIDIDDRHKIRLLVLLVLMLLTIFLFKKIFI